MTLGGSIGCLLGVPGATPPNEFEPWLLNRSVDGSPCCPPFSEFSELTGASDGEDICPLTGAPESLGGKGLFLASFSEVVEAEGVTIGDWPASLEEPEAEGDEVPSLESLFFLEDLFGSFERERTLCLNPFILAGRYAENNALALF